MNKGKLRKKLIAFILCSVISFSGVSMSQYQVSAKTDTSLDEYKELLSNAGTDSTDYTDYMKKYSNAARPSKEYDIDAANYVRVEGMDVKTYEDYEGWQVPQSTPMKPV